MAPKPITEKPAEPFLAYLTDHLGSVRAVVNQNGIVVETRDYDPFGDDNGHVGYYASQHRFTGQPADDQNHGFYNYGARFYNPKWGRFISPDEVTQGFDSQGLNPDTYASNQPTGRIDPDGRDDLAIAPAIPILGGVWVSGSVTVPTGNESSKTFESYGFNLPWQGYGSLAAVAALGQLTGLDLGFDLELNLDWLTGFLRLLPTISIPFAAGTAAGLAVLLPAGTANAPTLDQAPAEARKKNPFKGKPGSQSEAKNPDGTSKQIRRYGPDGYPETDTDYNHDHGQGKPHVHDWGRPEGGGKPTDIDRGPGRSPEPGDPGFEE